MKIPSVGNAGSLGTLAVVIAGLFAVCGGSTANAQRPDDKANQHQAAPAPQPQQQQRPAPQPQPSYRPPAPAPQPAYRPQTPSTPSNGGNYPGANGNRPNAPTTPQTPYQPSGPATGGMRPTAPTNGGNYPGANGNRPTAPTTPQAPYQPSGPATGGMRPTAPTNGGNFPGASGNRPTAPTKPQTPYRPTGPTTGGMRPTPPSTPTNGGNSPGINGNRPGGIGNYPGGRPGTPTNVGPGGFNSNGPRPTNPATGNRPMPVHNPVIPTLPARGSSERNLSNGSAIRTRPNGRVSDVHNNFRGVDIHQGLNGGRRITQFRPDHSRTVWERGRPGFVQRPYNFRGRDFDRRTYWDHGREYERFYRGYRFHDMDMDVYAPSRFWSRDYYGWAYNPWRESIRYRWGWFDAPWHRHFGFFFSPFSVYSSAAFWLTDYVLSQDLSNAYAAQQDGGGVYGDPSGGAAPLTPEIKQQIADEVRDQLSLERQEAQQPGMDPGQTGIARIFAEVAIGHRHIFLASGALDVVDSSGLECALSDGDALLMQDAPPQDAQTAYLIVQASKGGQECPRGDTVSISLYDLQEMQNHMRATIDQGLQQLQSNQGRGGLPRAPTGIQMTPAPYADQAPPPDPNTASELQQVSQQGDQALNEVTSAASQQLGSPATTPTITAGQSISEVESILGQPTSMAVLGQKVIYNYNGMKVTFTDGRVTNVE